MPFTNNSNRLGQVYNRFTTLILIIIFASISTILILRNANWIFGDDLQFLSTTALGEKIQLQKYIMPEIGRFFPLGLYDYNLLLLFPNGDSPFAHYLLNSFSFLIFSFVSYYFYKIIITHNSHNKLINPWLYTFCVIFLMMRLFPMFINLIFPERIVIVLSSIWILAIYKLIRTDKWLYGIISIISAIYLVYCKEPIFGALLIFALTNLFFGRNIITKKFKIVLIIITINSVSFLSLYYLLVFRHTTVFYNGGNMPMSLFDLIIKVFRSHKVLIIAAILAAIRLYYVLTKKDSRNLIFDGMLFAGIGYTCALIFLKLNFSYYFFPAVVFCLPPIIYWSLKKIHIIWLVVIMCFNTIYCSYTIIPEIESNQRMRVTTIPKIKAISSLYNEGHELVWIQPVIYNQHAKSIREWRKNTLQAFLEFIIDNNEKTLTVIDPSRCKLELSNRMLIFNPIENKMNKDLNDKLEKLLIVNEFYPYDNIGDIIIYKKKDL